MAYGAYLETTQNGIKVVKLFSDYKSRRGLRIAISRYLNTNKAVKLGYYVYLYIGKNGVDGKYNADNYQTIEQYNAKPFYDYWR